jgi:hypothetical protein
MLKQPEPVSESLVHYMESELPTEVISDVRKQTRAQITAGEIALEDAYTVTDLLLGIALMKLTA